MAVATSVLKTNMLAFLDESTASAMAEIGDGSGNIVTTNDTMLEFFLNRAQEEICRTCFYLRGKGHITAFSATELTLSTLVLDTAQGQLWAARTVVFNGLTLKRIDMDRLEVQVPGFEFAATGTAKYWYNVGSRAVIGLQPTPTVAARLDVSGPALPAAITTNGTVNFLPDDEAQLLIPYRAAEMAAKKNFHDPTLFPRAAIVRDAYDEIRMRMWQEIEPGVRLDLYPNPPVPQGAQQ
jgi:hypothetical protein